jgi:hypothetical protein
LAKSAIDAVAHRATDKQCFRIKPRLTTSLIRARRLRNPGQLNLLGLTLEFLLLAKVTL